MVSVQAGRFAAALAVTALLVAGVAQAEPADKPRAQKLMKQGSDKYGSGDYSGAVTDFEAAYQAYPSPKILFNLGQAYTKLHQLDLAADRFAQFLEDASRDVKLDEKRLKAARAALKQLDSRIVQVQVEVSPAGAALELDGKRQVRDYFYMARESDIATRHILAASAPGFEPRAQEFTLAEVIALNQEGKKLTVPPLKPVAAPQPAPQPGAMVLVPVPVPQPQAPATVTIPVPTPSAQPAPAPAAKPDLTPSATTVAQSEPTRNPDLAIMAPPPAKNHTPALVAMAVGGGLAVGATVIGLTALGQKNSLGCGDASNPCSGTKATDAEHARSKAKLADLLWGGAAVAGATGAVLWFVAPGSPDGAGSGGEVGVAGRF